VERAGYMWLKNFRDRFDRYVFSRRSLRFADCKHLTRLGGDKFGAGYVAQESQNRLDSCVFQQTKLAFCSQQTIDELSGGKLSRADYVGQNLQRLL
jgi:hypothetical protein